MVSLLSPKFAFKHHLIDTDLPPDYYAQTAAADLDGCGRPEYIVGRRGGSIYCYKCHAPDHWTRHLLGENSPSDVGACDLDGDGRFEETVIAQGIPTHEAKVGDLTGNGLPDIVGKPCSPERHIDVWFNESQ